MHDTIRRKVTFPLMVLGILGMALLNTAYASEEEFDAHAGGNFIFHDGDMDFHFINLILGSAVNGGVEIGESFYAASQIKDGDAASWQKQWFELARRVEQRGRKSLAAGHTVSTRDQFLRAAYYYRISLLGMSPSSAEFKERGLACRELMKQAGPLFDPALEYFEVPFEDTVLPGFFWKANASSKPAKTLIVIGGGETFIEDLYFYIAPQAHARGYNFMTVDLPGQGMLPAEGKVFRTDTQVPMKAVVDYALSRKDVDPQRLSAYGISGGGLFVPQAAQHDQRLRAIAVSSATVDGYALFSVMPAALATEEEKAGWSTFHEDIVKSICERYGVPTDDPAALIEANKGNSFDPAKITVPVLIIVGEGEYKSAEVQRQQKIVMDGLPNPAKK